jgi:ABC-type lipoprotein export system ATPase subunit
MKKLNEEKGQTFIVVTHDPQIAETAHQIVLFSQQSLNNFDYPI